MEQIIIHIIYYFDINNSRYINNNIVHINFLFVIRYKCLFCHSKIKQAYITTKNNSKYEIVARMYAADIKSLKTATIIPIRLYMY